MSAKIVCKNTIKSENIKMIHCFFDKNHFFFAILSFL